MPDVSLIYTIMIFGLGFLAGAIAASLFYEIRQRGKQAQGMENPSSPNSASGEPESSRLSHIPAAQMRPPDWIPGPWDTQPQKVNMNPVDSLIRSVQANTLKETPKPMSMAEEIDEILQEKLAHSEQAGRSIRLRSLLDQSLEVIVDGTRYNSVGEVNDLAAQALIQSAVTEWQRRIYHRGT